MPSIRVTVASNAKQSQKAPLIIPASTPHNPLSPSSSRTLVIKTAQSKLRLKKANRIFVAGGKELTTEEDWKAALKDDVVLLVSTGEDYVGTRNDESTAADGHQPSTQANPDCPIEILANKAFIDDLSIKQLETTARTLPGIIHAVAQPDLHPGTKFPIGAVFVSKGWIHPPLIGGDIGCGMAWYKTTLTRSNVEGDKGRKIAEKLRGLEGSWRTQRDREIWLRDSDDSNKSSSAGEQWDASLGTIGAGNHFAEIQVVEQSTHRDDSTLPQHRLFEGEVVLLVHSGSRGYGGDILKRYTTDGRTSIHEDEPAAKCYLEEHDRACNWASHNRDLIALRFLSCLEPGDEAWDLGRNISADTISPSEREAQLQAAKAAIQSRKVVDIWHNNVSTTLWPPLPPSSPSHPRSQTPQQQKVLIHRKGAAPTLHPSTSLPLSILPLPGSRATPTLILHPVFPPSTSYGLTNALSLAHGAGRAMSRAKAAGYVEGKYKGRGEDLLRGDFVGKISRGGGGGGQGEEDGEREDGEGRDVNGGTWVICEDRQLVWEEAGEAYKDVWAVGEDLVRGGVAERWGWCRGRVSYKVRRE